nr:hypothetical protein [Tanacetum cinerariifolium]
MTMSLTKKLTTPFKEPERKFRSSRKVTWTRSLDYLSSPGLNLFSNSEDQFEEEETEAMREPIMEEYMTKTREDYGSRITRPNIDEKADFELKGQFLKKLHDNTYSAIPSINATAAKKSIIEMVDHSQKWYNRTSTKDRSTETSDGLAAIQDQLNNLGREINKEPRSRLWKFKSNKWAKYFKKRDLEVIMSKPKQTRQIMSSQSRLLLKLTRPQYTSSPQNRMQIFKPNQAVVHFPSRLTDDYYKVMDVLNSATYSNKMFKERPKMVYQIKTSIDVNDSIVLKDSLPPKEKDPGSLTLPCYINNICFDKALADLGASVSVMPLSTFTNLGLVELAPTKLTVELSDRTIKNPKDIKVPLILGRPFFSIAHAKIDVFKRKITLRARDDNITFKSVKPPSSLIKRVYVLGLRERMDLDLEARMMGKTLILNRSPDPDFEDFIELNDLNEPLELKINQVEDLGPTIKKGEVIDKPMIDIVKNRNDDGMVEGINEYPSLFVDNMDPYSDQEIGDVTVGEPFCKEICI